MAGVIAVTSDDNRFSDHPAAAQSDEVSGQGDVHPLLHELSTNPAQTAQLNLESGKLSQSVDELVHGGEPVDRKDELVALVSLPGMSKDMIDLRVTEDTLTISAKAAAREGKYLRHEIENRNLEREIKLPLEVKPEQVKASFNEGILEVHLPKLVVVDSQRILVE